MVEIVLCLSAYAETQIETLTPVDNALMSGHRPTTGEA